MLGSSWVATQLAASQEGLSSMSEWVSEWWIDALASVVVSSIYWDITLCSPLKVSRRFGTCCLHLQGRRISKASDQHKACRNLCVHGVVSQKITLQRKKKHDDDDEINSADKRVCSTTSDLWWRSTLALKSICSMSKVRHTLSRQPYGKKSPTLLCQNFPPASEYKNYVVRIIRERK
jgi:hypothetical protein